MRQRTHLRAHLDMRQQVAVHRIPRRLEVLLGDAVDGRQGGEAAHQQGLGLFWRGRRRRDDDVAPSPEEADGNDSRNPDVRRECGLSSPLRPLNNANAHARRGATLGAPRAVRRSLHPRERRRRAAERAGPEPRLTPKTWRRPARRCGTRVHCSRTIGGTIDSARSARRSRVHGRGARG